jgi:geranylgeranyl diphosphate synthase type II
MSHSSRVERALHRALSLLEDGGAPSPPKLRKAVRDAVLSGGGRIRPSLTLAVSAACGDRRPWLAEDFAAAVELMHCASLVHDDLPCFDDAETRRGRPSIHRAYGEPIAVLAGDELIVLAFEVVARTGDPRSTSDLISILARATRSPRGIIAGQAWESESTVPAELYRRAKTASLFEAAACGGAAAAGFEPTPWRPFGTKIGDAYQIADDILDVQGSEWALGKPTGQDANHGRPSAVAQHGLDRAKELLRRSLEEACDIIPSCESKVPVVAWVDRVASRIEETLNASTDQRKVG